MHEKRAQTRGLMREDAVLAANDGQARKPVIKLDISRLGVCFASPEALEASSRHLLVFALSGKPQAHETVVQVVHSSTAGVPSGFRIGARFVHIQPETTDEIVAFVTTTTLA